MSVAAHASVPGPRRPAPPEQMCAEAETGAGVYRMLTGCDCAEAATIEDCDFDVHVLASIIAVASSEHGPVWQRVGLSPADFAQLMAKFFPAAALPVHDDATAPADDDELVMVRDLLLANRSTSGEASRWLACMIARRSFEPSHLWEDLGLRRRDELSRLLHRHFAPLAVRNTRGMRWKRFFYRLLCEDDGFVMCATPVCTECCDFDNCFGAEDGEGRLARRRRDIAGNGSGD